MEVLLKKNIEKLGTKDEIISVKNGFGRNYLIPNGHAILATDSIKKMHAETLKQRAHKENKLKDEANTLVAKLIKSKIIVPAKVGENGKIFGSVTNIQLADVLNDKGFTVDRKNINILTTSIKTIGKYEAEVSLHKEVTTKIEFEVAEG